MSFSPGQTVVVKGQLAAVVNDQTIAGQEFVGVVPLQAVQYVPASMVNAPPPAPPPAPPVPPAPPPTSPGPANPVHKGK